VTAKMAETLDHISEGRAILGIGGAWFELEHQAHGIDFGSGFGQRLDWLDEAVGAMRGVLDGKAVTSEPGAHYAFDDLRHQPLPVQKRLPIMIGGSGEKKTLRTVAKYADMWNAMGTPEVMAHKVEVLRGHCDAVGRDINEIEFTLGVKLTIRDSEAEADRGARQIASSVLCKCSWYGQDPYWGRLASELGSAGIDFDQTSVSIAYGGVVVAAGGVSVDHDGAAVAEHMGQRYLDIRADLGLGDGAASIITNDLTHAYVDENMGTS